MFKRYINHILFPKHLHLICLHFHVVLLAFVFTVSSLTSLYGQSQFNRLTQAEGLSNKNVNCILQDHNGFMWFGTNEGLNRYDGYSFTVYRTSTRDSNSIASNYITCLYEDSSGLLWIGTKGGGLNIYSSKTEKFIRYMFEPGKANSISSNDVLSIYYQSRNKIWLGTDGGGLNVFDYDSGKFKQFNTGNNHGSISSNEIIAMEGGLSGNMWIGTWNGGLNLKNPGKDKFSTLANSDGFQVKHIWSLTNEKDQKLWIGTFGYGLYSMDQQTKVIKSVPLDKTHSNDGDKVIWTSFLKPVACAVTV